MLSQFFFFFFYFLSLRKTSCTVWLLSLSPSPWSNRSQRPHCPVATAPPGLLLQCPPPSCQCGPLEQCLDSAAPEPPARYRSCSRNLRMKKWMRGKKKKKIRGEEMDDTGQRSPLFLSHLCRSCRSRCVWWCLWPPSGSLRWPEMWFLHRATPCRSYTPSLWGKVTNNARWWSLKTHFSSCCNSMQGRITATSGHLVIFRRSILI